ncbi:MAG TPA: chemotaxis response regulator protein-glutamate methylesterase, partial [Pseudomonadales bacterium]|nr:chemotaxis response regulator protein-glutamate methylesterase [Pseudomonadales bacterium]
ADPDLKVVGAASNGREAVEKCKELRPDVVTMDYEMPQMDGITAVKLIMHDCPTPILMFSSLTFEGARVTLDALEAGAVDYLPKNIESLAKDMTEANRILRERVKGVVRGRSRVRLPGTLTSTVSQPVSAAQPRVANAPRPAPVPVAREQKAKPVQPVRPAVQEATPPPAPVSSIKNKRIQLVVFGASTGGPVALQNVLGKLPSHFPVPILIVQHMPSTFTKAFADRLNRMCSIQVKEAENGDILRPGVALLAPGGYQMLVDSQNGVKSVRVVESDERLQYKPSVDVTFGSAAKVFGQSNVLAVVMTGMGSDGREGSKLLKRTGSVIWAQDEKSCVVYGMPQAVVKANLADEVIELDQIGLRLTREIGA